MKIIEKITYAIAYAVGYVSARIYYSRIFWIVGKPGRFPQQDEK